MILMIILFNADPPRAPCSTAFSSAELESQRFTQEMMKFPMKAVRISTQRSRSTSFSAPKNRSRTASWKAVNENMRHFIETSICYSRNRRKTVTSGIKIHMPDMPIAFQRCCRLGGRHPCQQLPGDLVGKTRPSSWRILPKNPHLAISGHGMNVSHAILVEYVSG